MDSIGFLAAALIFFRMSLLGGLNGDSLFSNFMIYKFHVTFKICSFAAA